ncbi:uncharacterized protein B0J16DRAFT_327522 [Fusarium flagelliforme]|uniref:uncharacterized protein n=1 Tax=Fusarium flagelliforme TaxID=2675880 RepID=UPI001E8E9202|nr:uncharacterized protein B0J16DRAFT_327522 [Fusarium flagelliforme]KAH7197130.1 hypothetical protein B0J16DRAFT_327522 [Fusarium flagelliforme]
MRKRKSLAVDTDSSFVRWHSVADMNTPSADIMSSPDPLNDTVEQPPRSQSKTLSAMPPSTTRRIVRSSQRSSRFSSGGLGTSPRKQTFELEVGDNQAPQKLLVTVETEEPVVTAAPSSARRKLFQDSPYLPVARRREMATTTTVPLKQTIEDQVQDPDATPRKRGRPRKNNGTPLPSAGTKRKGTPIAGSPRRRQRISQDTDTAENTPQPTTGKKRRGRPPKNRSIEPPSDVGKEIEEATSDLKSAQQDVPVDDITFASDGFDLPPMRADDSQADNDVTLVITPSEAEANQLRANRTANNSAPAQTSEPDSDIWMATLDDEPTPRPASRATQAAPAPSSPEHGRDGESSDFGDYGYGPAGSDVSSADEPQDDTRPGPEDTVAAGEDFSMIFMDSLPSLQASLRSSMQEHTENDIGEETSMIINNTLESLRQSLQDRDRPQTNEETAKQGDKNEASKEPAPEKSQQNLRQSTIRPPLTFSPNRNLSSRWLQSPRRPGSSPLRHQVLLKSNAPDVPETTGYRGSPLASHRYDASHLENEDSNAYDDSFSEIPDAVLEAATPRRPRATAKKVPLEKEDIQMEDAQLIELEDEPEEPEVQEEQDRGVEEPEVEEEQQNEASPTAASNVSAVSRSDAGRLPTPDDTPPNIGIESDNNQKSATASRNSTRSVSSRGSSPRHLTTEPVSQVRAPPGIVHEIVDEVVEKQADKGDELLIDFDAPAQEPDDHSDLDDQDHQFLDEPDDHSDVDEQVFEETVIDDPVVAESEVVQELPKVVEPHHPRLSLETEIQQPEVTPMNQLTSPVQEPQSQPEVVSERARRPTLSPIVRAGRALQSVTSDPPSPEARDQHLRSPFRSSASRELGPRESQTMRRMSASPGKPRAFSEVAQIPQGDEAYEDPFGTNSRHTGQQSFMEALERSSRTSSPRHRRTASRDSAASSTRFQAPSEGGMSWVQNEGPISPNLRGDVPLDAFARTTRRAAPPVSHGQIDGVVDVPDDETEVAGDDMDLWEFEAQRSSPRAAPKPRVEKKPESPYRRRGKLPSRWERQAARETQRAPGDEQRTMSEIDENEGPMEEDAVPESDAMEVAPAEPPQPEEYSLVTQKEGAKEPNQAPATAKANRFDLSNFFSSPAIIPGMLDKLSPLKRMSVFGARPAEPDPEPVMEQTLPTSSMFPQVPQQELAPRGQPRLGFFSPVRPAQPAPRQEPSEHSEEETYSQSNQSSPARRSEASSAHEEHDASMQEISEQPEEREQQDDTEEEDLEEDAEAEVDEGMEVQPIELPSVPQKANFTPERRRTNQSFFKASTQNIVPEPEPEQESIPTTGAPTPPRMQLSHADIHRWTQETSNASDDSPEPTPAKPAPRPAPRPLLRPLPPRNASPTKSSLRSPLKPHTPGRVVEFTSSVLSPIEQAKVRHQRRLSNSSAGSQASNVAQRPRVRHPPRQTTNKENNTTFENPVSNAGLPIKQTRPEPLSQTVWTRKHWLLLDDLLQERRQGPFITYYERCSDKYLGKMVRSQGEAMTLERWHLDCVDAFKAQVGGWDEGALAKRLFALILGERRRSQEASSGTGRVMFH